MREAFLSENALADRLKELNSEAARSEGLDGVRLKCFMMSWVRSNQTLQCTGKQTGGHTFEGEGVVAAAKAAAGDLKK